ncbi:MAG: hypothetical protein P8X57_03480 [Cyclobacteriaceae bacterium]
MRLAMFVFAMVLISGTARSQYQARIVEGSPLPYLGYTPENYNERNDGEWPLILFLHGVGEKGDGSKDDIEKVKRFGPPRLISDGEMPPGFIVIAPQLPKNMSSWQPTLVNEMLDFAFSNYKIDKSRVYLTGLSLGGNGTWRYAYSDYNEPNRLAAIAPVAAWGDVSKVCRLVDEEIAVWAFHGENDNTVEFERGKEMFDALKKCRETLPVLDYRFTAYEKVGHNSWSRAYAASTPELSIYEWFSVHTLKNGSADTKDSNLRLENIAELPASLNEASGMIRGKNNTLWIHNDSGNEPFLIQLNESGEIVGHTKIVYASNFDWEDITTDPAGNLYIADIGNNANLRENVFIYKVDPSKIKNNRVQAETIRFSYPDQKLFPPPPTNMMFDAETLIYLDGYLYVFTKNRTVPFTGKTRIYRVPDKPGTYTAQLLDSLDLGGSNMIEGWITGGDISPDKKHIVLLGHDKLYVLSCFQNGFSQAKINTYNLDSFTQKEAIAFSDNQTIWIADESFQNLLKGKLYRISLPQSVNSACN